MDYLKAILTSPAVWSAVVAILVLAAKYLNIPTDLTTAFVGLLIAILAAVGVGEVRTNVQQRRIRALEAREIAARGK